MNHMEITIAKTAGFCTGVQRAMNILLDTARVKKPPIYTLGPLIHNPQVIALLEQRGITPLLDPHLAPPGTIVIRAHGIPPDIRRTLKEKGFKICDATCPHVAQVQSIVKSQSAKGYRVIIIGDKGHAEVLGILGFAKGQGIIISSLPEVDALPQLEKVCVVAQTTQNSDDFQKISQKILIRFPQSKIFNTICTSTAQRQEEALRIAKEVEAMIIVGGKNSANTIRLAEMVSALPKPVFHIETAEELTINQIRQFDRIGVTAGASTPNWIIEDVIEKLNSLKHHQANFFKRFFWQGLHFLDQSDLFIALGALSLSYAAALLQNLRPSLPLLIIPTLYVFTMYLSNHLLDKRDLIVQGLTASAFSLSHYTLLRLILGTLSLIIALSLSIQLGFYPFLLLLLASIAGIVYSIPLIPKKWQVYTQFRRLKDIPASKDIFLAGAWAGITVGISLLCGLITPGLDTVITFLFIATMVFIRSVLQDIRDIQEDRIVGRETLPIIIGKGRIQFLLFAVSLPICLLLLMAAYLGWTTSLSFPLSLCFIFLWIYMAFSSHYNLSKGIFSKLIIDSNFLLSGLIALLWATLR